MESWLESTKGFCVNDLYKREREKLTCIMLCIADILERKVRENCVEIMLRARIADISYCYNFS